MENQVIQLDTSNVNLKKTDIEYDSNENLLSSGDVYTTTSENAEIFNITIG